MAANRKAITDQDIQDVEKALESEAATNPQALRF
jgi:hypothetical protein